MTNEFEQYDTEEFDSDEETLNTDELLAPGTTGLEYDFSKAPSTTKGPDREDLNGKTVTITDVKLILPPPEKEWELTKDKQKRYKSCQFILFYDDKGQREYYSGVKVFERKINGVSKYSDPTIHNNGKTQASALKKVYAEFKDKPIETVSLKELGSFLASKPKALVESKEFEFNDAKTKKNIVVKFL